MGRASGLVRLSDNFCKNIVFCYLCHSPCWAGLVWLPASSPAQHSKKAIAFVKTLLFCYICHSISKQNELFTKNAFCCRVSAETLIANAQAGSPHQRGYFCNKSITYRFVRSCFGNNIKVKLVCCICLTVILQGT